MKKFILSIVAILLFACPTISLADAAVGDVIITLGNDLTENQKEALMTEMKAPENGLVVTVSNEEEHQYLGDYIPKAQIGTRAISSSKITIGEKGSGLEVKTNHINWVTDEMYLNALMTAGVKDATIYVTAPFDVSGTAALTGLIKAYEVSTDEAISEEVKQIANKELVETAKLGDKIGAENASALIAKIKEQLAENGLPKDDQQLREWIEQSAKDLNITLSEQEINNLMILFNDMIDININWNQVGDQLAKTKDEISKFLESEEAQGFFQKVKEFFQSLFDSIRSIFQ
ncbi:DUF1002 domain-containing protein [Bacillus sp. FJAT-47783]|uniref:DUF1002 domain-containing protein n=1 Tax=Bacillus sp. FJAT-47783 TaxID=2922712 RepID=UPI001FAC9375|nr:DUF1002 domain-containing protein [Bacillus sp. FJAT-47783]